MRFLFPLIVLVVAACSPGSADAPDRLAILSDGNVVTIDSDGADPVTIAEDGPYFQPVWSTDAEFLAFAGGLAVPTLHVALVGDGTVFETELDSFPFYYSWSTTDQLGILRNGSSGLDLQTIDVGTDGVGELVTVEQGQPLYYSWSPDGDELVAHIGIDRFVTSDLSDSTDLMPAPGAYQAPSWQPEGILSLAAGDDRQTLVIIDGGEVRPIATVGGLATFLPNKDTSLVAVQSLEERDPFQSASMQTLPRVPGNRLVVVDVEAGLATPITDEPIIGFFWSPTGEQLLVLDFIPGPAARWQVWDGSELTELVRFTPDPSFVTEFLPFFDQYAQSVSLWSPDGSAIAFPGSIGDESGIWVQEIGGDPVLIADGTWVSWAP